MKRRTKKRLAVVVVVVVALPLLGLGARSLILARRDRLIDAAREEGMAAYARGDTPVVLDRLGYVVGRNKDDGEVLLAFADARARTPLPNQRHIGGAIAANRLAADALPGDIRPHRNLVRLYQQMGFTPEVLDAAAIVLEMDPADADALRAQAVAYFQLGRANESREALLKLLELSPTDPLALNLYVDVLRELGDSQNIEAWLTAHAAANDHDADVLLSLARWQVITGERDLSRETLRLAADQPTKDVEQLRRLLTALDALGLSEESERILAADADPEVAVVAVERIWKQGRYTEARQRAAEALEGLADPPADLVGLAALVNVLAGTGDADAHVAAAQAAAPETWGPLTLAAKRLGEGDPQAAKESLTLLAAGGAPTGRPDHFQAAARHLLATADAAMGSRIDAIAGWSALLESDASWIISDVSLVNALMQEGRSEDAYTQAVKLMNRAWRNPFVVRAYLFATGQLLAQGAALPESPDSNLRAAVTQIREIVGDEGDMLCVVGQIHVALGDLDAARDLLPVIEAAAQPPSPASLIRFAETARPLDSALAAQILTLAATSDPGSPLVVMSEAIAAARDGRPEDGVDLLQKAIDAASGQAQRDLERAHARFLRSVDPRRSLQATRRLAERDATDPAMQIEVLKLPIAWTDCRLIEDTLRRLGAVLSQDSATWKTYEARRLLECQGGKADASAALLLLVPIIQADPLAVEPRLLAAEANLALGDRRSATMQLFDYTSRGGRDVRAHLRLTLLLRDEQRWDDANATLRAALAIEPIAPDIRTQRALVAEQAGMIDQAKADLALAAAEGMIGADIAMIALAIRQDDPAAASEAAQRLEGWDGKDAGAHEALALYYTAMGDTDRAIGLIEASSVDDDQKALILARTLVRAERRAEAEAILEARAEAPGSAAEVWSMLIASRVEALDNERADALLTEALKRHPDNAALAAQRGALDIASGKGDRAAAIAAINAALRQQNADPALQELGQILERFASGRATQDQYIQDLDGLTRRRPSSFFAWRMLIGANLEAGRLSPACTAADNLVSAMPRNPLALRLATETLAGARRFPEALRYAEAWAQLPQPDRFLADMARAQLMGLAGRPTEGLTIAEPYAERLVEGAATNPDLLASYAGLLAASGQESEADAVLGALAAESVDWARRYIGVAGALASQPDARRAWLKRSAPIAARFDGLNLTLGNEWRLLAQRTANPADYEEAARLLEAASQSTPSTELSIMIAECHSGAARPAEAERSYRQALAKAEDPIALNNLASLIATNRPTDPEAAKLAARAVEIVRAARVPPDALAPFLDTLGYAQLRAGQPTPAIATFREALKLSPSLPDSLVGLAEALLATGDTGGARDAVRRARALPSLGNELAERAGAVERALASEPR